MGEASRSGHRADDQWVALSGFGMSLVLETVAIQHCLVVDADNLDRSVRKQARRRTTRSNVSLLTEPSAALRN